MLIAIFLPIAVIGGIVAWLVQGDPDAGTDSRGTLPLDAPGSSAEATLTYCGTCHNPAPPDLLPKSRWPGLIEHVNAIVAEYRLGRPLERAELAEITRYYVSRAPEALPVLGPDGEASPLRFEAHPFGDPVDPSLPPPVITNVNIVDLDENRSPDVLVSDVSSSSVRWVRLVDRRFVESELAAVSAPARTEVADVTGDGRPDVLVADLGGIQPTEQLIGRVVLLVNEGNQRFSSRTILEDVSRVADVRPADFDNDGDLDVLVAMYGLYAAGSVGWLEQTAEGGFDFHVVHHRNGISHVPVADLNGDGRTDFIALISQQHEEVIAFLNDGDGSFSEQLLYKAPHPMWGSSGLKVVDLDGDGDDDLLFTNGDAMDIDAFPKPWHGVQWLENRGDLRFVYHDIARFYGAYCAVPADLDSDGDVDIVVTSLLNRWDEPGRQSMIWLRNDGHQKFTRHVIAASPTALVSADVADLDDDGRPEIIAGGMYVLSPFTRVGRVTVWANLGLRE